MLYQCTNGTMIGRKRIANSCLMIWQRLSDKTACRIKDERSYRVFDLQDKTEVFEFMKEASDKMSNVFRKHILEYKH